MISIKKIVLLLCAIVLVQGFKGVLHASEHFVDVVPTSDIAKTDLVRRSNMMDRVTKPSTALKFRSHGASQQRLSFDEEGFKPVKVESTKPLVADEQGVDLVEPVVNTQDVSVTNIKPEASSVRHVRMDFDFGNMVTSVVAPSARMTLDDRQPESVKVEDSMQLVSDEKKSAQSDRDRDAQKKMKLARKRVLDKVHQLSTDQIAFVREIAAMDWLPKEFKQPLVEQGRQLQKLIDLAKELSSATGSNITQAQQRVEEQLEVVEQGFVLVEKVLSKYKDYTPLQKLATRHGLDVSDDDSVMLGEYPEGQRPLEVVANKSDDVANAESKTRVSTPVGQEVDNLPKTAPATRLTTPTKAKGNYFDTDLIGESVDFSQVQHTDDPPTEELKEENVSSPDGKTKDLKKGVEVKEQSEVRATTSWVRTLKWAVTGLTAVVAAYHVAKVVTAKPADLAATASTVTDTVATNVPQQDSKGWSFYPRY